MKIPVLIVLATLVASCSSHMGTNPKREIASLEDAISMHQESPGTWLVRCRKGKEERRSTSDILQNQICQEFGGIYSGQAQCLQDKIS